MYTRSCLRDGVATSANDLGTAWIAALTHEVSNHVERMRQLVVFCVIFHFLTSVHGISDFVSFSWFDDMRRHLFGSACRRTGKRQNYGERRTTFAQVRATAHVHAASVLVYDAG